KSFNYPVTLIRGLRTDVDFKEEEKKLRLMQDLYPEIKVAFIPCEKKYEHISSSTIVTFRHFGNAGEMYEVKDPYGLDVE
ncbi:hypothetical protein KAR91_05360, partial [Candidatus Pacearchaeota archaeon]|nr:hypothetical protein [Candidatus Pacearchaeota archaeon]